MNSHSQHELNAQVLTYGAEFLTPQSHEEFMEMAREDIGKAATHAAYDHFCYMMQSGELEEQVQERTKLQEEYAETFRPHMDDLRDVLQNTDNRQGVEGFIGAGTQANVYGISHDGVDYVARVSQYVDGDAIWADKYTAGMLAVKGEPHFEQIAAVSYEDGVVISERMPGKPADKLTTDDVMAIDNGQLSDLVETLRVAHERSIRLDTVTGNYMYDRSTGFGLIDLEIEGSVSDDQRASFGRKIELTAAALRFVGEEASGDDHAMDSPEYYSSRARLVEARIDLLQRFEQVVSGTEMNANEREQAAQKINQEIYFLDIELQELRDPQEIARMIELHKTHRSNASPSATESSPEQSHDESAWEMPQMSIKF